MSSSKLSYAIKYFHGTSNIMKASFLDMPAMSPTMTEGGITSWKVQPGESFSAGDVLLEVETDKASIDVEAQDDGKLWEILVNNGTLGIPVGQPIAILAETEDDLATLEKPKLAPKPSEKAQPEPAKEPKEPKETPKPQDRESRNKDVSKPETNLLLTANRKLKLLPSVEMLLHHHGISDEEAYSNIKASGPQGRILKGDVLAYVGDIQQDAVINIAKFVQSKQHLDLSNITLAAPVPPPAKPSSKPANILTIKLSSLFDDKNQFQYKFATTVRNAIIQTYAAKFPQYDLGPLPLASGDVFQQLLVASANVKRFTVEDVKFEFHDPAVQRAATNAANTNTNTNTNANADADADLFDALLAKPITPNPTTQPDAPGTVDVEFKVKSHDLVDSREFIEFFQNRLLSQVPSI